MLDEERIPNDIVRVLIVDDEPDNYAAYADFIRTKCPTWSVSTAQNVDEAIASFATAQRDAEPYDVVVADLIMEEPDSGYLLLERILLAAPSTVAITVSATADDFNRERALQIGIFDVISKNRFDESFPEHLLYRIKTGVSLRRNVQDAERLRRFLDPFLVSTAIDNPSIYDLTERRLAVVFWDLAGFSKLADSLRSTPTVISAFLDAFFSSLCTIVNAHSGVVDKFIGDGAMALFGLCGRTPAEFCHDALLAARAMRDEFGAVLKSNLDDLEANTAHAVSIALRCGIHFDEVLVGVFSAANRSHFTAIGSGVNLASRLEGQARPGDIVLSQTVAVAIRDHVDLPAAEVITGIKNISGDFKIYRL